MGSRYLLSKVLQALGTVVFIVILNFVLFRMMPGSPERVLRNPNITEEVREAARERWGLNDPVPIQLVKYLAATAQGDLGYSIVYRGLPVADVLAGRLWPTLILFGLGELIAIAVGLALGAYSGWRRGGPVDYVGNGASLVLYSMPYFVIGMFLLGIFATGLGWFPTNGMFTLGERYDSIFQQAADFAWHLFLPVMTVAIGLIGQYSIMMRSSVIDTLGEDYVTTAKAKGLNDRSVLQDHALPNALLPAVTLIAINLGFVIGGAITVEVVFNWPGLGRLTVDAVSARDYPVLQGIFLLLSLSVVFGNLMADLVYGRLDPEGPGMTAPAKGFDAPAPPLGPDAAPTPAPTPAGPAPAAPATKRTWLTGQREFWRQFARHRDGLFGIAVLVFFTIMAIAPQLFVGPLETVTTASGTEFEPPSAQHIFGTDELGRDILNLTVHGARVSMVIGLLATVITIFLGAVIGIVSGYFGGRTDAALMRLTDFFLVLPTFVLALVLAPIILDIVGETSQVAGIRMTLVVIIIVIGITSWASTARIIRSQALSVKERMFVDRARVIGASGPHIMRRHILPNVLNLIVANTVLVFGGAILTETLLAFVGLGDPFAPSWGQILNSAEEQGAPTLGAWWYIIPPATCVVLVVLAFTLVGGALDAVLNPRLRSRR